MLEYRVGRLGHSSLFSVGIGALLATAALLPFLAWHVSANDFSLGLGLVAAIAAGLGLYYYLTREVSYFHQRSELLGKLSQEARTAMTALWGHLALLERRKNLPSRYEHLEVVRKSSADILMTVEALVEFLRLDPATVTGIKQTIPLREFLTDLYRRLLSEAWGATGRLEIRSRGAIPSTIEADPWALKQLLSLLIREKARTYSQGKILVEVSCQHSSSPGQGKLIFTIRCFLETQGEVKTVSVVRKIAALLAQSLSGDVDYESASHPTEGTWRATVSVDLGKDKERDALWLAPSPLPRQFPLSGLSGLVVEDVEENRELLTQMLVTAGAEVVSVGDGVDAVKAVNTYPYDFVVMDIHMPRMNGFQAARTIREGGYPGVVVALTANVEEESQETWKNSGFTSIMSKPVAADLLVGSVARLMGKQEYLVVDKLAADKEKDLGDLLDKSYMESCSGKIRTILENFANRIPERLDQVRSAIEERDWERALDLTHQLRGTAANCGFRGLNEAVVRLENSVRTGIIGDSLKHEMRFVESVGDRSRQEFRNLLDSSPISVH